MKRVATVLVLLLGVTAVYWWRWTPKSNAPDGIAAVIDLPENDSICTVSLGGSTTRREVACQNVVTYLRNSLRLEPGAGIVIRHRGKYGPASSAVTNQMHSAGFLIVPDMGPGIGPDVPRGDR